MQIQVGDAKFALVWQKPGSWRFFVDPTSSLRRINRLTILFLPACMGEHCDSKCCSKVRCKLCRVNPRRDANRSGNPKCLRIFKILISFKNRRAKSLMPIPHLSGKMPTLKSWALFVLRGLAKLLPRYHCKISWTEWVTIQNYFLGKWDTHVEIPWDKPPNRQNRVFLSVRTAFHHTGPGLFDVLSRPPEPCCANPLPPWSTGAPSSRMQPHVFAATTSRATRSPLVRYSRNLSNFSRFVGRLTALFEETVLDLVMSRAHLGAASIWL